MLYFLLVKVFKSDLGERKLLYVALGWGMQLRNRFYNIAMHVYAYMLLGIPVPIVAISAGVAHDQYGHDNLLVITMLKTYVHCKYIRTQLLDRH